MPARFVPPPDTTAICTGLGLELWKDDRLRWKSEAPDPEANASGGAVPTAVSRPGRSSRVVPGPGGSTSSSTAARVLGVIPLRVWLIVLYLSILHIAVMVSTVVMYDCSVPVWQCAPLSLPFKHHCESAYTMLLPANCRCHSHVAMMLQASVQPGRRQTTQQALVEVPCIMG
jgi:hypothetical protein